jgi:hypothetical protein|tara:strand:- start:77 stop:361 length:285 start_codon:yes stop_codon:yes gene_type:complete
MATVTIENAVVARIIEGYGFKATEEFKLKSGETAKRWYTVWTKEQVSEGDVLVIEGELGVKLEEYTSKDNQPKTSVGVHVNNALIMKSEVDAPF